MGNEQIGPDDIEKKKRRGKTIVSVTLERDGNLCEPPQTGGGCERAIRLILNREVVDVVSIYSMT